MGMQHFMMKQAPGSPGYIARKMCDDYAAVKANKPDLSEFQVLRFVYAKRVAAQSTIGGPQQYRQQRTTPGLIDRIVRANPDLLSLITLAVKIEHPQYRSNDVSDDRLELLERVLLEVIQERAPNWVRDEPVEKAIVSTSDFEYLIPTPMRWTAWHNGRHHDAFMGYGFKISELDRDTYFERDWKSVTIGLPVPRGILLTEANVGKPSFWGECRELITSEIALWLTAGGHAPWPKGLPPKFSVWEVGTAMFCVGLDSTIVERPE